MNFGSKSVRISLRQADGKHYPLFHRGDPDTCNLVLEPATEGQAEAEIQFFFHPSDGSAAERIGVLRFAGLPAESQDRELRLDAVIGSTGLFTVTLRHSESGRVERLEMELPDEGRMESRPADEGAGWRHRSGRWILGSFFIAAVLALVFYLTYVVADWGREEPAPAPVSLLPEENAIERV